MNFSRTFEGIVWNIVKVPGREILILEIREEAARQVSFSAFHYQEGAFLWQELQLEESWWVSVVAASQEVVLFQTFNDMQDPQRKTLSAMHLDTKKMLWERTDFSFHRIVNRLIEGIAGIEEPEPAALGLETGERVETGKNDRAKNEISVVALPFQYLEGSAYFETIKSFLREKMDTDVAGGAEYLELHGLIFVSYYVREDTGLVNYLLVIDERGELLLKEKLGEALKGLGMETFFVLEGCLFFVRHRRELLSYKINHD